MENKDYIDEVFESINEEGENRKNYESKLFDAFDEDSYDWDNIDSDGMALLMSAICKSVARDIYFGPRYLQRKLEGKPNSSHKVRGYYEALHWLESSEESGGISRHHIGLFLESSGDAVSKGIRDMVSRGRISYFSEDE